MFADIRIFYRSKKSHILCAFKSINDGLYLIFQEKFEPMGGLKTYDIINNQIINEIRDISYVEIKHYLDQINKRDLILTCETNNSIQIFNFKNYERLIIINNIYSKDIKVALYSSCILNEKNQIYILTSCMHLSNKTKAPIKIYDLKGNYIKEINNSKISFIYIDTYFDKKISKNFIIACSRHNINVYDFTENKLYKTFNDEENIKQFYIDFVIRDNKDIPELICSNLDGRIRIWNFNSGELIKKISAKSMIYGISLKENDYLFIGCEKKFIKILDLKEFQFSQLEGHDEIPYSIILIQHQKFGDYLISGGFQDIIIWKNNDSKFEIIKTINKISSSISISCGKRHPSL